MEHGEKYNNHKGEDSLQNLDIQRRGKMVIMQQDKRIVGFRFLTAAITARAKQEMINSGNFDVAEEVALSFGGVKKKLF